MRILRLLLFIFIVMANLASADAGRRCARVLKQGVSFYVSPFFSPFAKDQDLLIDIYLKYLSEVFQTELMGSREVALGILVETPGLLEQMGAKSNYIRRVANKLKVIRKKIKQNKNSISDELRHVESELISGAQYGKPLILCVLGQKCDISKRSGSFNITTPRYSIQPFENGVNENKITVSNILFPTLVINTQRLGPIQFVTQVFSQAAQVVAMKRIEAWIEANLKFKNNGLPNDELFNQYVRWAANKKDVIINEGFVRTYIVTDSLLVEREAMRLISDIQNFDPFLKKDLFFDHAMAAEIAEHPHTKSVLAELDLDANSLSSVIMEWTRIMQTSIARARFNSENGT